MHNDQFHWFKEGYVLNRLLTWLTEWHMHMYNGLLTWITEGPMLNRLLTWCTEGHNVLLNYIIYFCFSMQQLQQFVSAFILNNNNNA